MNLLKKSIVHDYIAYFISLRFLTRMAFLIPLHILLNETIYYSTIQIDCKQQSLHIILLQKLCLHKKYSMKHICTLRIYICVYKPSILPLKNIQPLATEAETFVHTNIPWVTYLMKYYSVRGCEQSWSFVFASTLN